MRASYIILPIISITLIIISSALINFSYGLVNETSQTQTYENRDIGIKLSYPSNWGNIVEKDDGCQKSACILSSDGTSEVRFGIFSVSKDICNCTLKDFIRTIYKLNQRGANGFSFINDNRTIVGKNILVGNTNIPV